MGTTKNVRAGRRHAPATQAKPRGTDLVTASELIPGFCRSKSNVPTPGSLRTIKSPTAGIVSGIKSPPLARTLPPPYGIYIDRCIISFHPLPFIHVFGPFMLTLPLYASIKIFNSNHAIMTSEKNILMHSRSWSFVVTRVYF